MLSVAELAKMIDHSILMPGQSDDDLKRGIEISLKYNVKCVVPKTYQGEKALKMLAGSDLFLCLPVGFPHGFNLPAVKKYEAELACQVGALELDMVMNTSALKSGEYDFVEEDVRGVVEVAAAKGVKVKAILETCVLTDEEKVAACKIAERAGAKFVKTSTAYMPGGATPADIRLMRANVSPDVVVKASGFVTNIDQVLELYEAGARRFGTSYTEPILEGLKQKLAAQ